jgi:hypothetical protein
LKATAAKEVANGYSVAITATIRAHSGSRPHVEAALLAAGGKDFDCQDVINAGRAWTRANPDARFVGADFPVEVQLFEAKEWLLSAGYKVEYLVATREVDGIPSPGFLFADDSLPS